MSAINKMLRDLDKRGALVRGAGAPGAAAPAPAAREGAPNRLASAYAGVRLRAPAGAGGRRALLAGGLVALLPIAWAVVQFERPAALLALTALWSSPSSAQAAAPATPVPEAAPPKVVTAIVASDANAPAVPKAEVVALAAKTGAPPAIAQGSTAVASPVEPPAPAAKPIPISMEALAPMPIAPAVAPPAAKPRAAAHATVDEADAPAAPRREPRRDAPAEARDTRVALAAPTASNRDEPRIERKPTDARDDLTRAGEAMAIGRASDAIVLLNKVIQAEPGNERARLALLSLLSERGRDDTWRAALADSARALPRRFGLAAAQGMAESGRFDESLAILKGLPESVRDTRYYAALGATHQQLSQHADAVVAFDAALGLVGDAPQLPSLLVAQALSMQSLGKQADARRNLERVRQMPDAAPDVREFAARELAHSGAR